VTTPKCGGKGFRKKKVSTPKKATPEERRKGGKTKSKGMGRKKKKRGNAYTREGVEAKWDKSGGENYGSLQPKNERGGKKRWAQRSAKKKRHTRGPKK